MYLETSMRTKTQSNFYKKKKGNLCDGLPSTLVFTGPVLNVSGQIRQISTEPSCRHQSGEGIQPSWPRVHLHLLQHLPFVWSHIVTDDRPTPDQWI